MIPAFTGPTVSHESTLNYCWIQRSSHSGVFDGFSGFWSLWSISSNDIRLDILNLEVVYACTVSRDLEPPISTSPKKAPVLRSCAWLT